MPPKKLPLSALFGYPERDLPQFSPNGHFYTFVAPDGENTPTLWLSEGTDTPARIVLPSSNHPLTDYKWAHTNQHIFFLRDHDGDENWKLHVLDLQTGAVTNITPHRKMRVLSYAVSPHHPHTVAFIVNARDHALYDVYTYSLKTQRLTIKARNDGTVKNWILDHNLHIRAKVVFDAKGTFYLYARKTYRSKWYHAHTWPANTSLNSGPIAFSPNNKTLYFSDAEKTNTSALMALDTTTKKASLVAHDTTYDMYLGAHIQDIIPHIPPYQSLLFTKNGSLAGFSYYREYLVWHFLPHDDTRLHTLEKILENPEYQYWIVSTTEHGTILGRCKDDEPISYWHYCFTQHTLTALCPPTAPPQKLAHKKAITIPSRDGLTLHGYLTMPPGTTQAPLIVKIHGGPWTRDIANYQPDVQFLVSRGYGCLQINYRGSSGYGTTFANAGDREWGGRMIDDVVDGALWACEQGITHRSTLAVMGRSYGGYAALCAATRYPDLFTCVISEVPPTHLPRIIETLPQHWRPFFQDFYQRVGHPTKDRKRLTQFSPALNSDKLTLPLLIAHGVHDQRVCFEQAQYLLNALSENELPLKVLSFENEGHQSRKSENIVTFHEEVEQFLARYLPRLEPHGA